MCTEKILPRTQRVNDVSCGDTYTVTPPKSTTPGRVQFCVGTEQKTRVASVAGGGAPPRLTVTPYPNTAGSRRIRDGYLPHVGACLPHRLGTLLSERVRTHCRYPPRGGRFRWCVDVPAGNVIYLLCAGKNVFSVFLIMRKPNAQPRPLGFDMDYSPGLESPSVRNGEIA